MKKENRWQITSNTLKRKVRNSIILFCPKWLQKTKRTQSEDGSPERFSNTRLLCIFRIAKIITRKHKNHKLLDAFTDIDNFQEKKENPTAYQESPTLNLVA